MFHHRSTRKKSYVVRGVMLSLLCSLSVVLAPVAAGTATAAPSDCSSLAGRIAQYEQARVTHDGNMPSSPSPADAAAYNAEAASGEAWGAGLRSEQATCNAQGVNTPRVRGGNEPPAPGVKPGRPGSSPTRPSSPRAQPQPPQSKQNAPSNPTPGYARPGELSKPAQNNKITSTENADGSRTLRSPDGGSQQYGQMLRNGDGSASKSASGASGQLKPSMLRTGSRPRSGAKGDIPPGYRSEPNCQRGHLIASQLGGQGTDPRNIVTVGRKANINMRTIENLVAAAVRRGIDVSYRVVPVYGNGLDAQPTAIEMTASGDGMEQINETIQNPVC